MVYLSRIALNAKRVETMRAISSPQVLHGAVERGFAENRQRSLWRIDWVGHTCYLLVLSSEKPNFSHIVEQFGYPDSERQWLTKEYAPLLERLQLGQIWQFRLRANPVRSSSDKKDAESGRGKVFAHITPEQQRQWLLKRASACGFILEEHTFDVVDTQWKKFRKGKDRSHEITLRTATFEGILKISDLEKFKKSLLSGVGRAKAYGCGLLTIARCGGDCDE